MDEQLLRFRLPVLSHSFANRLGLVKLNGLAILLAFATATANAAEKIRITNGEWPPYLSKDLQHDGVASRIVSEAFALQGIRVEYGFFPWNRSLQLARSGKWDGSAVWLTSPERAEQFYLSDPVLESIYVFFHLKSDSFSWQKINDLADMRIGGTLEYNYGEAFETAEKAGVLTVERVSSDEQNFARLLAKRIRIFPMDQQVGHAILRKRFSPADQDKITFHPLPLRVDALRLLLSRKNPANAERMEKFNKGLKSLRDSGKIRQYLEESKQGKYEK